MKILLEKELRDKIFLPINTNEKVFIDLLELLEFHLHII